MNGKAAKPETAAPITVVGIGASAGGINALKQFFAFMPGDSGIAFVVILHLSQEHESHLADILQTSTSMPVLQVQETLKIEPNKVYVIPPAKHLKIVDGTIQLAEPEHGRGKRVPVDLLFRSLGDAYQKNAICIVLSGTGSDGTLGLKRVKEAGGIALVQDPVEAEYDGMPRSAIETNLADLILPVAQMPEKVIALRDAAQKIEILDRDDVKQPAQLGSEALGEVLTMLRVRTRHDFANYKRPTLLRRIARRLQVHELDGIPAYLHFLRENPEEVQALLRDLLITVTNFFRDQEAFSTIESKIIPQLFQGKTADDQLRVWVAGCATGEEAYSIAILLSEYAERLNDPPGIQVFASDIDERAIGTARDCRYDEGIVTDVSADRLKRFFVKEGERYCVKKALRETVLFAPHNLLRDPPFSRLDLISCRNLLIYLNRETQENVLQIFHFALRSEGFLFLGSSETAESGSMLFSPIDKKHKLYKVRAGSSAAHRHAPTMPALGKWGVTVPDPAPIGHEPRGSFGELHHSLVELYAPPSVLVNEDHDLVHLSEKAGRFLRVAGGEPSRDLLKLVHPGLKLDLHAALIEAKQEGHETQSRNIGIPLEGKEVSVSLIVRPFDRPETAGKLLLVIFEETETSTDGFEPADSAVSENRAAKSIVERLEDELSILRARLRATLEQNDTSTEELKASNEELQAINEELRSASEELETSKEELQSLNEELTTVNHELKDKIEEVSHANSDLHNLIQSTDIGTIFLDGKLQIKRYTPRVQELFNLIPSDIGRPLDHLTHKLDYHYLQSDASEVLRTRQPLEREIDSTDGSHFLVRLAPYRTVDEHIDGVVLNFLDVTERVEIEAQTAHLASIVRFSDDAIIGLNLEGNITSWNEGAERLFGYTAQEAIGKTATDLIPPLCRDGDPDILDRIQQGEPFRQDETVCPRKDGTEIYISLTVSPIQDRAGRIIGASTIARDITERKRMESIVDHAIIAIDVEGCIQSWNPGAERIFGYSEEEIIGQSVEILFTSDDRAAGADKKEMQTAREQGRALDERFHLRKDGSRFYVSGVMSPLLDNAAVIGYVKVARDLTDRQKMEQALKDADRRKDEFLATLAHELRNPLAPIRTGLQVMGRGAGREKEQAALEIVKRQVEQIIRLVDDLLDVSRITAGKVQLQIEEVELSTVVKLALETNRPLLEAAGHELQVTLPSVPVYLEADETRLAQALLNLLNNAVKYTEPGGIVQLSAATEDHQAVIRIKDSGVGIPTEMLSRIFDMFAQVDRPSKHMQGGLGIGLTLVKNLVDLHGGTIEASSGDSGSEFVVRLPLPAHQKPKEEQPTAEGNPSEAPDPRLRILVVDDNVDAAEMLELALSLEGHEVFVAYDGAGAVHAAAEKQPDLILLDIGLPDMSGYQCAEKIRSKLPQVPLIALTGWGQDEDRRRSKAAGFDYHLVKPVDIENLQTLFRTLGKETRSTQ